MKSRSREQRKRKGGNQHRNNSRTFARTEAHHIQTKMDHCVFTLGMRKVHHKTQHCKFQNIKFRIIKMIREVFRLKVHNSLRRLLINLSVWHRG